MLSFYVQETKKKDYREEQQSIQFPFTNLFKSGNALTFRF